MTINDQNKDEKLQYDINREAAKISPLSSGKLHKYEYLTGEDILPSNQQQIIEQTKFTYSPLGKAFDKQIKAIEDQGKKQVDALENLKPKEETKPIKDTSNNQSRATITFNDLINKGKELMSKLYDSVDYKDLKFEYIGPTEDVSFYEYMDSKELFNAIKNSRIRFSDAVNKQNEFLNKLNNIKIGKKTTKQKEVINNITRLYLSREEVFNFFRYYVEMLSDANCNAKQNKTEGKRLKILTPKQMLQRLPIALAEVKAGNNSEHLLNEIRQIIYSLYQSKEITKKSIQQLNEIIIKNGHYIYEFRKQQNIKTTYIKIKAYR